MASMNDIDWPAIRRAVEAGESIRAVAARFGVSASGIRGQRDRGWPACPHLPDGARTPRAECAQIPPTSPQVGGLDKKWLFAEEYLKDRNRTQAAIRAGYSPLSARDTGCRLLKNPDVRAHIDARTRELLSQSGPSPEEVIRRLNILSGSSLLDIGHWDKDGFHLRPSDEIDDDAAYALAQIEHDPERGTKVKLSDRLSATKELAKHFGLDKPAQQTQRAVIHVVTGIDRAPGDD